MNKRKAVSGTPAEQYEQALELARSDIPESKRVADLLKEACAAGEPRAAYALATWHLFGHAGFPRDVKKAVKLLRAASKANVPAAHFDLAVCYETGQGVKKNETIAYRHYLAAALYGDEDAFNEVGRCLYHGIGVERDRRVAAVWLDRAETLQTRNS